MIEIEVAISPPLDVEVAVEVAVVVAVGAADPVPADEKLVVMSVDEED